MVSSVTFTRRTAIAALMLAAVPGGAAAETYPDKPITLVVAASVGGSIDALARQLAPVWEKKLGQRINVENKTGGGGIVGVRYFMQQPSDGYTVLICTEAHFTATMEKTSLKTTDVELINMQQFDPTSFTVLETSRFKTLEDLLKEAQAKPNTISWGSPASGSAALVGKLVAKNWNIDLRFIPQAGGAETDTALLGGHVDVKVGTAAGDISELKGVRVIAIAAPERLQYLPDVPTFNEVGSKLGFKEQIPSLGTARLVVVQAGLKSKHPDRFQKLVDSYKAAFHDPAYQEVLKKTGQMIATTFYEPADATAKFRELVEGTMKHRKDLSH
ncbi:MAG TPA: tripartite tricarboxylate transporter substrate binding protein [Beijerinckiaceae bacterium]